MHLLVTNDFPPKHGGIQSYLWELWRRLPPSDVAILTSPHPGARAWDAAQPWPVIRTRQKVLLPTPGLRAQIDHVARDVGADLVLLDPALPLGALGPHLERPFGLVLHGAEVTVPGRTPGLRSLLGQVLRRAAVVVAAGGYPADEAERAAGQALPVVVIPPGVDTTRFRPLDEQERARARSRFGLPVDATLVISVSRLVPRKGMDTTIRAVAPLGRQHPHLALAIGGAGRDRARLARLARQAGGQVHLLGRIADADLPAIFGCADVFALPCRNRWFGLEQEGFGIVFLEAAACGVAQVAGASGGAAEAVADGETGLVVRDPGAVDAVTAAVRTLVEDPGLRRSMGAAGRARAEASFDYDGLAARLAAALAAFG